MARGRLDGGRHGNRHRGPLAAVRVHARPLGTVTVRAWAAVAAAAATFVAALSGILYLGARTQAGEVRVLVTAHPLPAGTILSATTQDLNPQGELVRVGTAASAADVIPQRDYAKVAGAVTLVDLRAGELLLWHDLARRGSGTGRLVTLRLAELPAGLAAGGRVDLFAVSGTQTGLVVPSADLCRASASAGCVVPLASSVLVDGVNPAAQTIEISAPPSLVSQWLFMEATQLLWAVPAGTAVCPGAEAAVSDPAVALAAIQRHADRSALHACVAPPLARVTQTARGRGRQRPGHTRSGG